LSGLYCGVDIGTTNLKVLLLDDEGQTLWVKSVPAPHVNDEWGVVTDARALLLLAEELVVEGWRSVARGRKISAIATAGIGEDGVGVNADLQPLGPAIQWNDRRGEAYAKTLAETEMGRQYPAILLDFSSSAGKWQWLHQHKPQELAGAKHWLTMTDYLMAQWSGVPFMSATLAPRTGCYDVFTRNWIPSFLQYSHAPPLPPLREAGETVGSMRGGTLIEVGAADQNTLLVAGGHDHPVAASAIRRIRDNARIDSMGTANATYGETSKLKSGDDLQGLYVTLPISGAPGAAVIGMTEFSVTLAKHVDDVATLYRALQTTHELPKSIIAPLTELAQRTKHYWSAMTRAGVPPAPIYATGGWSRCAGVMQLRANIFAEPVIVVDEPELVALGAALYAAQATRDVPVFSAAAAKNTGHVFFPA
jgi:xylulokinase